MMKSTVSLAIERRAARASTTVEGLIEKDREALRTASYPGPLCLDASVFTPTNSARRYDNSQLLRALAHVLECPMCAAQVDHHCNGKKD